jgi:hypothetical protein
MGDIKRGITSISDLKRGSTDVNFVYRGTNLVWQRTTPTIDYNIINFNTEINYVNLTLTESKYTSKINVKY